MEGDGPVRPLVPALVPATAALVSRPAGPRQSLLQLGHGRTDGPGPERGGAGVEPGGDRAPPRDPAHDVHRSRRRAGPGRVVQLALDPAARRPALAGAGRAPVRGPATGRGGAPPPLRPLPGSPDPGRAAAPRGA